MRTRYILWLITIGAVILYCAKVFIEASINTTTDSMDAYYSILGWTMYLVGWLMFIGGNVASAVKLVKSIVDE